MKKNADIVIIGGGLAGLTSGIQLTQKGLSVLIIEKSVYPRHKVCGEYISSEILPYLKTLGADITNHNSTTINRFRFTNGSGSSHDSKLPLGGIGISRYQLDNILYELALKEGCTVIFDRVKEVQYKNETFFVKTTSSEYTTPLVLGAYGKRSGLDQNLSREFINKKSPWLAVKAHYKGNFPSDLVGLYHFPGGYCGVSKVEDDILNICYLANYKTFKKYKNIEEYQKNILCKNPELHLILQESKMIFKKPLTISQISFKAKKPVVNHILMIGDTAGLIHPLCGNGMAMAIHSAKIASGLVFEHYKGNLSRSQLESEYAKKWKFYFSSRIKSGHFLASILQSKWMTRFLFSLVGLCPPLLTIIIKKTHGKPV